MILYTTQTCNQPQKSPLVQGQQVALLIRECYGLCRPPLGSRSRPAHQPCHPGCT